MRNEVMKSISSARYHPAAPKAAASCPLLATIFTLIGSLAAPSRLKLVTGLLPCCCGRSRRGFPPCFRQLMHSTHGAKDMPEHG